VHENASKPAAWAVALALIPAACGCGSLRELPLDRDADVPGSVRALWQAHGTARAWRRQAAVSFSYEFRVPDAPGSISFPEVAFRLRDHRYLWIRASPGGEIHRLSLQSEPGALAGKIEELFQAGAPRNFMAADYALRSIRYFLELPLSTSTGSWEFRTLLAPEGLLGPSPLEVVSLEPSSPHGACLLQLNDRTGILERVLYAARHPFPGYARCSLALDEYCEVEGMKVARRRVHKLLSPPEPADPFRADSGPRERQQLLLEERVSNLRFLNAGEAEASYPLPEEEPRGEEASART
jgi:hypothetical protein